MVDNGYDIEDYTQVDPMFGSLQDFKDLLEKLKSLDIKTIVDFVPNHTSDKHEWFIKSRQKLEPFSDFYVWRKGKTNLSELKDKKMSQEVPTNWVSNFLTKVTSYCYGKW